MQRRLKGVIFFTFLAAPSTSYAYLDPGTGSMILQGLIAAIALSAVTIKMYWHKFVAFFKRRNDKEPEAPPAEDSQDS
jgi:hypothetical protein